ncbi:hypothetical protein J6590_089946, partial [Homalodisca vitripennis]
TMARNNGGQQGSVAMATLVNVTTRYEVNLYTIMRDEHTRDPLTELGTIKRDEVRPHITAL